MASAMTGSGKTAAYVLPIIELLKAHNPKPRVLVLVPTRELALQVESQVTRFGKNSKLRTVTLYGGTGYEKQNRLLRRGVDVIVATPGRLLDCVERRTADLTGMQKLPVTWTKQTACSTWASCRKCAGWFHRYLKSVKP